MTIKRVTVLLLLLSSLPLFAATFPGSGPHSTNNDDTCDIGLFPAATLLLPHFNVNLDSRDGETTLFTVTNVSADEQIAMVTLWTDAAYPMLSFPIYLTGYDTQSINLYDVLALGQIAPPRGTGKEIANVGDFSNRHNPARDTSACGRVVSQLGAAYRTRLREAFTRGTFPQLQDAPWCERVGRLQKPGHAVGYATIDVVQSCSPVMPTDSRYFTNAIAFDNVLTGEYLQLNPTSHAAEGNPLVHIRAIPEGETAATRASIPENFRPNFPTTFYGRFTGNSKLDGRQPLPSRFATKWIEGGPGDFQTELTIWREPNTGIFATCEAYAANTQQRSTEYVVFDEEENAVASAYVGAPDADFPIPHNVISSSMRLGFRDGELPSFPGNATVAGWVYVNLDDPRDELTGFPPRQGWVTTSMRAEGRYSVNIDAIALGNGCSAAPKTEIGFGTVPLGPSPNVTP